VTQDSCTCRMSSASRCVLEGRGRGRPRGARGAPPPARSVLPLVGTRG
jgi:hypothetical protein